MEHPELVSGTKRTRKEAIEEKLDMIKGRKLAMKKRYGLELKKSAGSVRVSSLGFARDDQINKECAENAIVSSLKSQ